MNGMCNCYERRKIETRVFIHVSTKQSETSQMLLLDGSRGKKEKKSTLLCFTTKRYSHGRTCALFNSVQQFIEIQGWLFLTFFICLHNQLSCFNSIIVEISEKRDS